MHNVILQRRTTFAPKFKVMVEKKKLFIEFQILIDDRRKLDNLSLELNFHKGEKLIWKIPHRS